MFNGISNNCVLIMKYKKIYNPIVRNIITGKREE